MSIVRVATVVLTDGRRVRRAQNREAVLDALVSLFAEGVYQPSSGQIAERAGISPRSLFRYFDDVDDLSRAAIARHFALAGPLFETAVNPGAGTEAKIHAVVEERARLHETVAPVARAARASAHRNPVIADQLRTTRSSLRAQLVRTFAAELDRRDGVLPTLDALLSFEAWELLRGDQGLSRAKAVAALVAALAAVLCA